MTYLLDTHTLLWMLLSPEKLSFKVRQSLQPGKDSPDLLLSAISLMEIATLIEKGRIELNYEMDVWIKNFIVAGDVNIIPVNMDIAIETGRLIGFNHYDPADRIIVATARMENAVLITADRVMRRYAGIKTFW